MARDFSTRTDTDKTDLAKYPNGRLKDGLTDGTEANESVLGDMYQVFLKAMRDAGITPNGLPDNETNGWQMFDACFGTTKVPITTFYNGVVGGSNNPSRVAVRAWKENGGKTVRIEGWIKLGATGDNDDLFQVPTGIDTGRDHYIEALGDNMDHPSGTLFFDSGIGIVRTTKKISGSLNDVNHYINVSLPVL